MNSPAPNRLANSIISAQFVDQSAAEEFERRSRGRASSYAFASPPFAYHDDPPSILQKQEAEADLDEKRTERTRSRYKTRGDNLLRKALSELPDEQREVIVRMRLLPKGWQTSEQVAEQIGLMPNTVRSRFRLGRDKLRVALPTWEEMYPRRVFTHAMEPSEAWIEHLRRDNRDVGVGRPDELIEDHSEWIDKHDYSTPALTAEEHVVSLVTEESRREAERKALRRSLARSFRPLKPLTEAQSRLVNKSRAVAELERAYTRLEPLETQAARDAASPEEAAGFIAEVLRQLPGDDTNMVLAVNRSRLLWRLISKRYQQVRNARIEAIRNDLGRPGCK